MLREPQLVAAKSKVEAAEAAVRQAQLDLSRTTIQAPFRAQVINRSVDVGSEPRNSKHYPLFCPSLREFTY